MREMAVAGAAEAMGARIAGPATGVFCGVCTDTRAGAAGTLFFALRGENGDGHRFVRAAVESGASAVVVDHVIDGITVSQLVVPDTLVAFGDLAAKYRAGFVLPVVGITGSVGKTSTRDMVACALAALGDVLVSRANFNNEIGVPHTLFGLSESHRAAVVEMAMRGAGQIARLADIAGPKIGVVTNVGLSHIEILGSRDAIAAAKAELLEALPPDGAAVINADDDYADYLRCRSSCQVVTFGIERPADFQAKETTFTPDGEPRFRIAGEPFAIHSPGVHHVANAAGAAAVASILGVPVATVASELERFRAPAMRMAIRQAPDGVTVLDDAYNAAPDSVRAALDTLMLLAHGRRTVAVLGDMRELGAWTEESHRYLGDTASERGVGLVVGVGEAAAEIVRVAAVRLGAARTAWFAETESAAAAVPGLVMPGDVVLVKGSRVMAMERIVSALHADEGEPGGRDELHA